MDISVIDRIKGRASNIDAPDTSDLRERVLDFVEDTMERASDLVDHRPDASSIAHGVRRHSRAMDLAAAAVVAAAPAAFRAARERVLESRRTPAARLVAVVPVTVTRRTALAGGGVAAGIVAGLLLARALRKRRRARLDDIDEQALRAEHDEYLRESDPQRFDLELEVERMEGEGGDPAAAEAPVDERGRRFGRSAARSNGASVR